MILNIAFYKFVKLDNLPVRRMMLRARGEALGLKGTILLSEEGINGFLAGSEESIRDLQSELRESREFSDLVFKESVSEEIPFTRMLVKIKKEIIPMGIQTIVPEERTAPRVTPKELKAWLDQGKDFVLLDTRNDYEIKLGTFEKATDFGLQHFRTFPEALKKAPEEWKKKDIVMFCTGGIRCEKATAYAEEIGYKNVYQLDGGILKYFEDVGGDHYKGECFVFDQRVAVDAALQETQTWQCFECRTPLTWKEQRSPQFVPGVCCPYCVDKKGNPQHSGTGTHASV